jgi:cell division protein FtsB
MGVYREEPLETQIQAEFGYQTEEGRKNTVAIPRGRRPSIPLVQAYNQAPWRIATQRGVLFLIVAILGASILWVMVSVTVQAASAGLEIQQMENDREEIQRQIAGLRTDIANQTSAALMKERAEKLGFEPINPEDITYLVVPGFEGREPIIHALPPSSTDEQPILKPVYTQSLWEWLFQGILDVGEPSGQLFPARGTSP